MTWTVLLAGPVAVGFGVIFNVRRRALLPLALLAIVAKTIAVLIVAYTGSLVGASLVAAFFVGTVAYTLGPATGEASPVYGFASIIPLIPGVYVFNALRSLELLTVEQAGGLTATVPLAEAVTNGVTAAAIVLALVVGATSPMLLLPRMRTAED